MNEHRKGSQANQRHTNYSGAAASVEDELRVQTTTTKTTAVQKWIISCFFLHFGWPTSSGSLTNSDSMDFVQSQNHCR